jgi:hypothetical protein
MSTLTFELPESVRKTIEELAAKEGFSVSQFLASAASEKLAVMLTMDYLRRETIVLPKNWTGGLDGDS